MNPFGRFGARLSSNRRSVLSIFTGIAAGQLLALLAAPLLSRLYGPVDFGIFATCSAIVMTIGTVAALRLELAIPLPERDQDAYGLATLGLLSSTIVGLLCAAGILTFGDDVAAALAQPGLMPWLWLVPPGVAAVGYYAALNQLAIRKQRFVAIGRRSLLQSIALVVSQMSLGSAGLRPGGLVVGLTVGQVVSAASLLPGSGLRTPEARSARVRKPLLALLKRYRRFPLILGPSGLLNVLGLQLPVLLLAAWYGGSVAGWMGLTQRILAVPVTLIGTAVAQVYVSEIARAVRTDLPAAAKLFRRASVSLLLLSIPLLAGLLLLGPQLFSVVFGPEWKTSGQYAQALAVGLAAQLVAAPLSQTLIVLERQMLQLAFDIIRVVAIFVVILAVKLADGTALTAVWAAGVTLALTYVLLWALSSTSLSRAVKNVP